MNEFDLVVKNGRIVDPASAWDGELHIGIRQGVIDTLALSDIRGRKEIDAAGKTVTPGFIDLHTHVDGLKRAGECMARMGVTTAIGGNCGFAMQPEAAVIGAFLDRIDTEGFPVHHGLLVGAQDLRKQAGLADPSQSAAPEQLSQMIHLAEEAFSHGALGLSFGLAIAPGTSRSEVVELFRVAARHELVVAVHPRYFGPGVPGFARDAVAGEEELFEAAGESGAKLQISHLASQLAWKTRPYDALLKRGLEAIERARDRGIDVMADSYPYDAWCMYPEGSLLDGLLLPQVQKNLGADLSMVEIGNGPHQGERLTKELFLQIKADGQKTLLIGRMMKQDLADRIFLSPLVMVGSDGIFEDDTGRPIHPRGAGTFPRVLRRLVREKDMLTLNEALAKMTIMPARRFGLTTKGRIAVGAEADLTVFDLQALEDRATYQEPDQGVSGMAYVIVSGQIVVEDGRLTGATPGRSVRPG